MRPELAVGFSVALGAIATGVLGADCSAWEVAGFRPDTPLEQVLTRGAFHEVPKMRDPLGYRRYEWIGPNGQKVELQVDVRVEPPVVVGVSVVRPGSLAASKELLEASIAKWGPPQKRTGQGAFTLYQWSHAECDVTVRMTVMNTEDQFGVWTGINRPSFRDEYQRRMAEGRLAGQQVGRDALSEDALPPPEPAREAPSAPAAPPPR